MSEKPKSPVPSLVDPSVLGAAQEVMRSYSAVDPKTLSLAHDAARMFDTGAMKHASEAIEVITGMDSGAVASVAQGIAGFDTSKFVASEALTAFAGAFWDSRSVVAPQIAQALAAIDTRPYANAAEAVNIIGASPAFKFAKTIDAAEMASVMTGGISKSIKTLDLSKIFGTNFANSVTALLTTAPPNLVPSFEEAAKEAIAMAETQAIADPLDASLVESVGWLESLPPTKRRMIISHALVAIAALLGIAGWLSDSGEMKAAGLCLGAAVTLIRFYWAVTEKDA